MSASLLVASHTVHVIRRVYRDVDWRDLAHHPKDVYEDVPRVHMFDTGNGLFASITTCGRVTAREFGVMLHADPDFYFDQTRSMDPVGHSSARMQFTSEYVTEYVWDARA